MRLAKPDPGTHWRFNRGYHPLLTGPVPKFELVEDSTGEVLGRVFIDASFTKFGAWWDSWMEVRFVRREKKRKALLDQLENPMLGQWEVK